MLGKLIKHEFKATYVEFLLMFAAVLGIATMEKVFMQINSDNIIVQIFSVVFTAMYVICIIGGYIGCAILIVKRFYVNLIKDQGYLTFTLPVTINQHIISKTIVAIVWTILTYIVMLLTIGIMLVGNGLENLPATIRTAIYVINTYGAWKMFIEIIALMFLSILSTILQYYACIAFGQMMGKHKIIGSIAAYFLNNMIMQVIMTGIIMVLEIGMNGNANEIAVMSEGEIIVKYVGQYAEVSLILMVVLTIVYYLVTKILLEKKLNLE